MLSVSWLICMKHKKHIYLIHILFNSISNYLSDVYVLQELLQLKASWSDLICWHLLNEAASEIPSPLASVFNKSPQDGYLPTQDYVTVNIIHI